MEEIETKIKELQELIKLYNKNNKKSIEEITIYIDYSKILITKTNLDI